MKRAINQLVQEINQKRRELDDLLQSVPSEQWLEPLDSGGWNLKDTVAHIIWFEKEVTPVLQTHRFSTSDLWDLPPDERNHQIYLLNQHRPLDEVIAEAAETFGRFIDAVAALDDEDLQDSTRFVDMPPEWEPIQLIAVNSSIHYEEHIAVIKKWLNR